MIKVAKFDFKQYAADERFFIKTNKDGYESFAKFIEHTDIPEDVVMTNILDEYMISISKRNIVNTIEHFKIFRFIKKTPFIPQLIIDILFGTDYIHKIIREFDSSIYDYDKHYDWFLTMSDNQTYKILDYDGIFDIPSEIKAHHSFFFGRVTIDKGNAVHLETLLGDDAFTLEKEDNLFFKPQNIKPGTLEYYDWKTICENAYRTFTELSSRGNQKDAMNSLPDNAAVFAYLGATFDEICIILNTLRDKFDEWKNNEMIRRFFCRFYREFDVFNDYAYEQRMALKDFYEMVRKYN